MLMPIVLYTKLVNLCFIQSHSRNEKAMVMYIINRLLEMGLSWEQDKVGNIIVTKGTAKTYPCVVSHMDTVHKIVNNYKVYKQEIEQDDIKLYAESKDKPTGIGGDDKCGVFSCLYFLKVLPIIKCVFFTQEEIGCVGSGKIDKKFFDDCRYIIQLDRRGSSDFIDKSWQCKTISKDFASEVGHLRKQYGFKSAQGTITDAVHLWRNNIGISCLNLSAGYYNAHSDSEYIMVNELWNTILFTKSMIKTLKSKRYICIKPEVKITKYIPTKTWCSECKQFKIKYLGLYKNNKFICYVCLGKQSSGKDTYIHCDECYIYVKSKTLTYNLDTNQMLCKKCLSTHKSTYLMCCICKEWKLLSDGRYLNEADKNLGYICNNCNINDVSDNDLDECKCDVCGKVVENAEELTVIHRDTYACIKCFVEHRKKKTNEPKNSTLVCEVCKKVVDIKTIKWDFSDSVFKCEDCYSTSPKNRLGGKHEV